MQRLIERLTMIDADEEMDKLKNQLIEHINVCNHSFHMISIAMEIYGDISNNLGYDCKIENYGYPVILIIKDNLPRPIKILARVEENCVSIHTGGDVMFIVKLTDDYIDTIKKIVGCAKTDRIVTECVPFYGSINGGWQT